MDHRRNDDGCSVFVLKEYAYDVLKTPVTTAIGHPGVPYRYRSLQATLIRLPRDPFGAHSAHLSRASMVVSGTARGRFR